MGWDHRDPISAKSRWAEKSEVLPAIGKLAADVRRLAGRHHTESIKLSAQETFTADSLEAATNMPKRKTCCGTASGKKHFLIYEQATKLDSEMGRAYAGYAVASLILAAGAWQTSISASLLRTSIE